MFKEGRRRAAVRSLGKVVHYAKVQLRFQHSQVGAGLEGGAAGVQKSIWKKGDPQLHRASCYPLKNTPFSDTKKAGVINAIAL